MGKGDTVKKIRSLPAGSAPRQPDSDVLAARIGDDNAAAPLVTLLENIARGDRTAISALYDQTIGRVYGMCLRIARKPEAAEEIVADVYMQVWRSASSYNAERGHPLAWLLVIARSRALDHLRRADPAESHPDPQSLATHADGADDPHNLVAATQSNAALNAALAALPAVQRQLLALAFFQGMTHHEIAAHAHLPLGTVKTHVRRALAALRVALGDPG